MAHINALIIFILLIFQITVLDHLVFLEIKIKQTGQI